jgi:multiple sugar transport system substrate-binding protein
MSKKSVLGLAILMVFGMLAACSSNKGNQNAQTPAPSASASSSSQASELNTPITLQFASWSISEEATKGALEQMAQKFQEQHKNVKIEFIGIPFGDIKQQTFVMASSGNTPDIIQTFTASFPTYAASDIIVPLDDLMGKEYIDDLFPSYKDDYSYNGKLMGIPWAPSPYVLYWNKELFKQAGLPDRAPQTYDEMLTFAEAISKLKTESGEQIFGLGEATEKLPINGLIAIRNIYSFNGSIFDAEGKVNVNTPEVVDTLKYYQSLVKNGLSPQGAKLKDLRNLFSISRLGMYSDGYYGRKVFQNLSGKGEAFDQVWGTALIPTNKTNENISIGEAHGLVISKDSKNPEMAAQFIKFLTDEEMITLYHQSSDVMSARKSISALPSFNISEFDKTLVDQISNIKSLPANNPGLEQAYLEIAEAVQRVAVTNESPEKVAADLDTKLKKIMK